LRFDVVRLPAPHCYRCPMGKERTSCELACVSEAAETIEKMADRLAGLVIEPLVQGAAGMIVHPDGYLRRIAEVCKRHGVLLVADEVATGFGRTGTLFACSQENVVPDILCIAKGLSGGYLPLAATMTTEQVFSAFLGTADSKRAFLHGHTYTGNPLACAAALASLELLDHALAELPNKVALVAELLDEQVRPLAHVGDIRQKGLMVGIELVQDVESKGSYPAARRVGHRVILEARRLGVILRPLGDVIVLMPPLAMNADQLEMLVNVTAQSIERVTQQMEDA
jgi:adenosylmethionine-8-amino-7-oxononanoate aminotransferase